MATSIGLSTASVDLQRTRRIIETQLGRSTEFQGSAIFVKDAPPYEDDLFEGCSDRSKSGPRTADPGTELRLEALMKIILTVFTKDIATDNVLLLHRRIKSDFKVLPLVGIGSSYLVRKLDDAPIGARASGSIASSRIVEGHATADGRVREKPRVAKQLRAARARNDPERSRRLLDGTMTELSILTHHPLKMHDNILDFLGVMWEYDDQWRVWPVLILEFADMGTLAQFLASRSALDFAEKLELGLDMAEGLYALHKCGVAHGDIKPDNIFVFRHEKRGVIAKIGDFSTSITEVAMKANPREALKLGGFTPLWVAPEHPEVASFRRLLAMDIFSFGLCFWTVVENGGLPLEAEVAKYQEKDTMRILKESKRFPGVLRHAIRSSQRPGICDDIDIDLFSSVLEKTLCDADDRNLDDAIKLLRKSPLRPLSASDFISSIMPKTLQEPLRNIDMRVLKELPRAVLIQLRSRLDKPLPPIASEDPATKEFRQSQQTSVIFRMQLENLGSWTLLEAMALSSLKIRFYPTASKILDQVTTSHGSSGSGDDHTEPQIRKVLEMAILGAVCDKSPNYSAEKYGISINEKVASAISLLFRDGNVPLSDTALAASAIMALNSSDACSEDVLMHCMKTSLLTGQHSFLRVPGTPFHTRLERLQWLAIASPAPMPLEGLAEHYRNIGNDATSHLWNMSSSDTSSGQVHISQLIGAARDTANLSMLDLAVRVSHLAQLRERLKTSSQKEINWQYHDGHTALFGACKYGNVEAVRLLLAAGARADMRNKHGLGVLHFLSSIDPSEQDSLVRQLVSAGADPNALQDGIPIRTMDVPNVEDIAVMAGTPLHHAVMHNDLGAVRALVSCGAQPLVKDKAFLTPLALAAAFHSAKILSVLLEASGGVDIGSWYDHYGNNLVCTALDSQWNSLRMAIHHVDFFARTKETLQMLWELRADFENLSFAYDVPALHYACRMASPNVVALLLEMGLRHQINKMSTSINLPLHEALAAGNEHLVLLLLDQGADVKARGFQGAYSIHEAIKSGTAMVNATNSTVQFFLDLLLDRGADINELSLGKTALHQAFVTGLYPVAWYLLHRGADIDHHLDEDIAMLGIIVLWEDQPLQTLFSILEPVHPFDRPSHIIASAGLSVLHLAAGAYLDSTLYDKDVEVLKYLLFKYRDENHLEAAWGKAGLTPLMVAIITGNFRATKLLIEAGASLKTKNSFGWSLRDLLRRDYHMQVLLRFRLAFIDTATTQREPLGQPNMAFDLSVWPDIMQLIVNAFCHPRAPPRRFPAGTSKSTRQNRVERFFELARRQHLEYMVPGNTEGDEEGSEYLKEEELDVNHRVIDVPVTTISEMELVLDEQLVGSPFITHVSRYALKRTSRKHPYRPVLFWELESGERFETLSSHLSYLRRRSFENGVAICTHVAAGLSALHKAGFTHGRLDIDHVRMRGIVVQPNLGSLLRVYGGPGFRPVGAELWDFDYSANARDHPAYHVYFRSKTRTLFEAPELAVAPLAAEASFEMLKKYDVYALAVLVLCVLGDLDPNLTPTLAGHRRALIERALTRIAERSLSSKLANATAVRLVPELRELLCEDPVKRAAAVTGVLNALQRLNEIADGAYFIQTMSR